jgi:hypothetical protein
MARSLSSRDSPASSTTRTPSRERPRYAAEFLVLRELNNPDPDCPTEGLIVCRTTLHDESFAFADAAQRNARALAALEPGRASSKR